MVTQLGADLLAHIGATPLVQVEKGIFAKLEYLNPSGSIKARIAKYMIEHAETQGLLKPGMTIVEASSGNTGNALSMVAAVKGYKMLVLMPEGLSSERVAISKAFGAQVRELGDFHVNNALEEARLLGQQPGFYCPGQFDSELNVEENREVFGPEILADLGEGRTPDAFVMGVGTGGTLIGVGQCLHAVNPSCWVVGMEPDESCTILCGEVHHHKIEGIADGFIPGIFERHYDEVNELVAVSSLDAITEMYALAKRGYLVGPSSGANLVAARRLKDRHPEFDTIVTVFCDEGEKYLSEYYLGQ
ncbi:cysteine synthase family protein [Ferrimicrobium sp.]|uniref:PLP-dependent cysteine synthase family protein n=1 Tax=Ferrimicrobium sp. TaxID=2926050 RepID=UPI00262EB510|nr:cysteine synthase family protein [Ferrimicrobium sp.]